MDKVKINSEMIIVGASEKMPEDVKNLKKSLKTFKTILRSTMDCFSNIIQKNADAIIVLDKEGIILFTNPAAEVLFGLSEAELIGGLFGFPISVVETTEIEIIRRSSKDIRFAEMRIVETEWEGTSAYLASIRDITKRRQTEEALKESEEKFRAITSNATDAIILVDNNGKITYWNKAAERIFGYRTNEAMGKDIHLLLAPKKILNICREGLNRFKTSGKGSFIGKTTELSAMRKDGQEFPVELSLSAFKIKGQWHSAGIIRDITEQVKLREELQSMSIIDELTGLLNRR